jgi:hypothetical protein
MKTSFTLSLFLFLAPFFALAGGPSETSIVNNFCVVPDSAINGTYPETDIKVNSPVTIPVIGPNNNTDDKNKPYDWRKEGLFKALFHAGVNLAQIDGDAYAGFNSIGFDGGVGVMMRFHKYMSVSIELDYTMWGAKANLVQKDSDFYKTKLDYVQVPIAFNVHDKDIIMFSAGVNLGFLVNYKEVDEQGTIVSDTITPQPSKFDLDAFGELNFIIKKQFGIGVKYSYSMIPFRGVENRYLYPYRLTKINGEYNNVITVRLMYILGTVKKK